MTTSARRVSTQVRVGGVAISSTKPGLVVLQEPEPIERYWRSFCAAREIWYGPAGRGANLKYGGEK